MQQQIEKTVRKVPCEIYCRPVGYYRPINNFNKGKQAEFWEREDMLRRAKMHEGIKERLDEA